MAANMGTNSEEGSQNCDSNINDSSDIEDLHVQKESRQMGILRKDE